MKKKKVACWCSFEAISWLYPLTWHQQLQLLCWWTRHKRAISLEVSNSHLCTFFSERVQDLQQVFQASGWRRLRVDGRSEGAGPTLHGNLGRDRVSPLWVYEDGAVPDDRSRHVHEGVRLVPVYGQPGYAPPGSVHQTLGPRTMTGMTGSGASLVNCHIAMENHNV